MESDLNYILIFFFSMLRDVPILNAAYLDSLYIWSIYTPLYWIIDVYWLETNFICELRLVK